VSLTTLVIILTLFHIPVFGVMLWIRLWRTEYGDTKSESVKSAPCAVCGGPATEWGYDGLDPYEQRDPSTGRAWSADVAHYRPVCAAHAQPAAERAGG